jgi:hypothetical protein
MSEHFFFLRKHFFLIEMRFLIVLVEGLDLHGKHGKCNKIAI